MSDDDTRDAALTREWVTVARRDELPTDGTGLALAIDGREFALFLVGGVVHAIDDSCPHQGGSLGLGVEKDGEVTCPWHGWHFDLATGRNTDGLASCVAVHRARVTPGGAIEVVFSAPTS